MSSNELESLLLGKTTLYLAQFLCEYCFKSKLIYFVEEKLEYPQNQIEYICPHCEALTTHPLQFHHRTKKVTVLQIEGKIVLSLLNHSVWNEDDSNSDTTERFDKTLTGTGHTLEAAQLALLKRYPLSDFVNYLQQVF